MPDQIGNITVPTITASGTFPIVPDFGYGQAWAPQVAVHLMGNTAANLKIEQRFLLSSPARRFTVRRAILKDSDRAALRDFWESRQGPYQPFTYNAPSDDGKTTSPILVRFENQPLSWDLFANTIASVGVTLVEEIDPSLAPIYPLNSTETRFPSSDVEAALAAQVQQIIPLIKIIPKQAGYPAIYLSDRRCTIGGQLYQARLLHWDGISQSISGNQSDSASFTFGNADRVMRDLAGDTDLYRARIEFEAYHVGSGVKLDIWAGEIVDYDVNSGPEFPVQATDGFYELRLPAPCRSISRTCWKVYNDGQTCPFASQGSMDLVHFRSGDSSQCDHGYNTPNGCLAHRMKRYYGAIEVDPQGVTVKDNSTGFAGFGRKSLTSVSLVNESMYGSVLPEIYTDVEMPVTCKVANGRDEGDFYCGLGVIGAGPLGDFALPRIENQKYIGPMLDGQTHHGFPGPLGLRQAVGNDPAGSSDYFSLGQTGASAPDWRHASDGYSYYLDTFAAGVAFIEVRRTDPKGLQLTDVSGHSMSTVITSGLKGWVWSAPGARSWQTISNPIWVAVNTMLRAKGLLAGAPSGGADAGTCEQFFNVARAVTAAGVCDATVDALIGAGTEPQFKFRGLIGGDGTQKPLTDWLQEIMMNCVGYFTLTFGQLSFGVRDDASAVESFTQGNILFGSLSLKPLAPTFNHLTANFADSDFQFTSNAAVFQDVDRATFDGGGGGPVFKKAQVNLCGTSTKSQAARVVTTRGREELGGTTSDEWKAARQAVHKTTILGLGVEPGTVYSLTHEDVPGGSGKFRCTSWKLNPDWSIEIAGQTVTDSMYDIVVEPGALESCIPLRCPA